MALSPSEDNRQGVVALWIGGEEHAAPRARADRGARLPGRAGLSGRGHTRVQYMRFEPAGGLSGELRAPADKSISHRAALLGAMASEPVRIEHYLHAADTDLDARGGARARRARRGARRRGRRARHRPARGARAGGADRRRQRRHAAAAAARLARRPGGALVHARRRRVDPPPPGRPDRRAAAPDGRRASRRRDGRFAAARGPRRAPARDLLRARRRERPGQVVRAARRAGRGRRDDRR